MQQQQHRRAGVHYSDTPIPLSKGVLGMYGNVGTFFTFEVLRESNGIHIPHGLPIRLPTGQEVSEAVLIGDELEITLGDKKVTYVLCEGLWREKRS